MILLNRSILISFCIRLDANIFDSTNVGAGGDSDVSKFAKASTPGILDDPVFSVVIDAETND